MNFIVQKVSDRSSEFRTRIYMEIIKLDGRVVVLSREKDNYIHSDIRSSKIEMIKKNPNCSLYFTEKKKYN